MSNNAKVDILTIGDELLLGICDNTNLTYLGGQLARHGLSIGRNIVLRDQAGDIAHCFKEVWKDAGIVITTGGLGPTKDDLTRESLAKALGLKLVYDASIEMAIRGRFEKMGRQVTDNNFRQAYLIEGAEALANKFGTAPGQWFQTGGKILVILPGPPNELQPMVEQLVLPRLQKEGLAKKRGAYLQIRTSGVGESMLETKLQAVFKPYGSKLLIGYCFHDGMVDVRISPADKKLTWQKVEKIGEECKELLGEDFVCFGDDCLGCIVLKQLRAMGKKLAVAESCTGGLLASAFTDIPGASKVFKGGLVCYCNDTKMQLLEVPEDIIQQHGAVSEECAVAMATGAAEKFEADYALSITGFAGPEGGTPENPVGTIYFGYHSPVGVWSHKIVYPGNRLAVKQRAVNTAIDWMRRKLKEFETHEVLASLTTNPPF